jgi:hypothetical protein
VGTVSADRITTSAGVYVTAQGAVDELGPDVTVHMVRAWARTHHVRAVTSGRRVYYPLDALRAAEQHADESRATAGGRARPRILTSP